MAFAIVAWEKVTVPIITARLKLSSWCHVWRLGIQRHQASSTSATKAFWYECGAIKLSTSLWGIIIQWRASETVSISKRIVIRTSFFLLATFTTATSAAKSRSRECWGVKLATILRVGIIKYWANLPISISYRVVIDTIVYYFLFRHQIGCQLHVKVCFVSKVSWASAALSLSRSFVAGEVADWAPLDIGGTVVNECGVFQSQPCWIVISVVNDSHRRHLTLIIEKEELIGVKVEELYISVIISLSLCSKRGFVTFEAVVEVICAITRSEPAGRIILRIVK